MFSLLQRRLIQRGVQRGFHSMRGSLAAATTTAEPSSVAQTDQLKWQHLVTPTTPPGFSAGMKQIEQQLASMRNELVGVPDKIEPINWSEWEAKIEDKTALQQIRTEYEQLKIEKGAGTDVQAAYQNIDKTLSRLEKARPTLESDLADFRQQLSLAEEEKVEIHKWTFHDFLDRYPGLREQLADEYMNGYQLPSDAEDRLMEVDLAELKKQVRNGQMIPLEADLPDGIGYWSYRAELKKLEAQMKKLYGDDSPEWTEIKEAIDKELTTLDKQKPNEDHAEEHH